MAICNPVFRITGDAGAPGAEVELPFFDIPLAADAFGTGVPILIQVGLPAIEAGEIGAEHMVFVYGLAAVGACCAGVLFIHIEPHPAAAAGGHGGAGVGSAQAGGLFPALRTMTVIRLPAADMAFACDGADLLMLHVLAFDVAFPAALALGMGLGILAQLAAIGAFHPAGAIMLLVRLAGFAADLADIGAAMKFRGFVGCAAEFALLGCGAGVALCCLVFFPAFIANLAAGAVVIAGCAQV